MPKPIFLKNHKSKIAEIIRVNHIGELGACKIYQAQIDLLSKIGNATELQKVLKHMLKQEEVHLEFFTKELSKRKTRPSLFVNLWGNLSELLGVVSAKLGQSHIMMCTDAVEEVINEHYKSQINELANYNKKEDKRLLQKIEKFRLEELEHQDCARDYHQSSGIKEEIFKSVVRNICKVAIFLSKKY